MPARHALALGLARTYQQSRMLIGAHGRGLDLPLDPRHTGRTAPAGPSSERSRDAGAGARGGSPGRDRPQARRARRNLSHGEHRQVAIAMALASEPRLLMLDEPASGLSRGERQLLTELLLGLDREITLDPHRARHGRRTARRRVRDDDARRSRDRRGNAGRDQSEHARARPLPRPRSTTGTSELHCILEVAGLERVLRRAQALHDVSFSMGRESVAIVGRNGMGKTTLCAAIMGFDPPRASGSVTFEGAELVGKPAYKIARAGLGYVPQGRRLFPSLTVNEHLKIAARSRGWRRGRSSASTSSSRGSPSEAERWGRALRR